MRVLGIDPGLRTTGWGVIDYNKTNLTYCAHGIITPKTTLSLASRLSYLFEELLTVIDTHQPDTAAVEETFVNKNPLSTLKLGQARGVVLLAPAYKGLEVAEYAANKIKKAVVGAGHASKDQMVAMTKRLLPTVGELQSDAADALSVAICHAVSLTTQGVWENKKVMG